MSALTQSDADDALLCLHFTIPQSWLFGDALRGDAALEEGGSAARGAAAVADFAMATLRLGARLLRALVSL